MPPALIPAWLVFMSLLYCAVRGILDSYAAYSWNLLLNSFCLAGDRVPRATLRNWLVLLSSMVCLLRRSRRRFLFLWMSLCESICLCLSCSLRSLWILLRRALRAFCWLYLLRASCLSICSSRASPARSLSSFSNISHYCYSDSAAS